MARNFQISDVKKAIEGSGGYMTNVAKKLGCDWHTAKSYIEKYKLQYLLEVEDERFNDFTEMQLMERVKKGDTVAIIFRLKTKAKKRGYIERQEIEAKVTDNPFKWEEVRNEGNTNSNGTVSEPKED